jgi:CMP-N-acetylneuraminic acid synthetase
MKAVAFIFARGGSKGLPGKNIKMLAGKPLIAWSIEQAKSVPSISRIIVSTDSEEIATQALKYGAEVPFMRPEELCRDSSPEWPAWQHALRYLLDVDGFLPDIMVSIPTTAPLRLPVDIENCLNEFKKGEADVVITVSDSRRSPYFNMVRKNLDETVSLVMNINEEIARRQDAPVVFDMETVAYVARPEFVLNHRSIFEGRVFSVNVPPERAIDIDTLFDFQMAEFFMKKREDENWKS